MTKARRLSADPRRVRFPARARRRTTGGAIKAALWIAAAVLALAPVSWSRPNRTLLEAEDLLTFSDAKLSPETKEQLESLIHKRLALLATLKPSDFTVTNPLFGFAINEPKALQEWREFEDKEVRKLAPNGSAQKIERTASNSRLNATQARTRFSALEKLTATQRHAVSTVDGKKVLTVDVTAPAPSSFYELRKDSVETKDGALVLKLSLVSPDPRNLVGVEPSATTLNVTHQQAEPLPKRIEIWLRRLDASFPIQRDYHSAAKADLP